MKIRVQSHGLKKKIVPVTKFNNKDLEKSNPSLIRVKKRSIVIHSQRKLTTTKEANQKYSSLNDTFI